MCVWILVNDFCRYGRLRRMSEVVMYTFLAYRGAVGGRSALGIWEARSGELDLPDGAGEVELYGALGASLDIHPHGAALVYDLGVIPADLAQEGQGQDGGAGAGAAGQGEVLHAPLVGEQLQGVLPGEAVEVDIGPLGEAGVIAQGPGEVPQLIPAQAFGPGQDGVGMAGAAQLDIAQGLLRLHQAGAVEADAVELLGQAQASDDARRGLDGLPLAGDPLLVAEAAEAAGAVAAHLGLGAVGIVEQHFAVGNCTTAQHHQAVGTVGLLPVAVLDGQSGQRSIVKPGFKIRDQNKIVPCPYIFK